MISNATWFFELDRDRFKKVVLKTWDGKTSISVLIHDDLGMAISETETVIDIGDNFTCETTSSGVTFIVKGKRHHF